MFLRPPNATASGWPLGSRSFDKLRADLYRYTECLSGDFRSRLETLSLDSAGDAELMVNTLTGVIADACDAYMPRKRLFRRSNTWWTRQLANLMKTVY